MKPAQFEEKAYEAPLYNQLEHGTRYIFTPGQVLENHVGFDRGIAVAEHAIWQVLGYRTPPSGIALGYYDWPVLFRKRLHMPPLPRFRLNLFIQAKRPNVSLRRPRAVRTFSGIGTPCWSFNVDPNQQRKLEHLSKRAGRRAHVTYAAPAFHTYGDLYLHTKRGTIVSNSTFPSALALAKHRRWYYSRPGAIGVANPEPEFVEEASLLARLDNQSTDQGDAEPYDTFLARTLDDVTAAASEGEGQVDAVTAQFFDDRRSLDRALEPYELAPAILSYAGIQLFAARFNLNWLIYEKPM